MKVQQILDLIDARDMALPEFQRGYVWSREQVRGFFTSLYRDYPVGGFLVWHTDAGATASRGGGHADGKVKLLLDGQQRATSLYGVIRGKAPQFFEGNEQAFTGLHFNVIDEVFEFYAPGKMKGNPEWVNVSTLMKQGLGPFFNTAESVPGIDVPEVLSRLNQITMIKEKDIHLEDVVGQDKTIDVVVDIFNRVNSGGTKLSKGDLALAKICAGWPEARQSMNEALAEWEAAGYKFTLDWLLRVMNGVATGKAPFSALETLSSDDVKHAFSSARKYVGAWLDVIAGRLGLDHDRVLFGRHALVVLARLMHLRGGSLPGSQEQSRLLYWYANAGMWGRYAGSTETALAQDLEAVQSGGVDKLIDSLRLWRGGLTVRPEDFAANSIGARFYPTLYMLTRTLGARDWDSGVVLSKAMLGHLSALEVHHIFPKAQLYSLGYKQGEVNALANFCFLTKGSNLKISASRPADYMPAVEAKLPGALASQWVPPDRDLWDLERYRDFLQARQGLLADAANKLLTSLLSGQATAIPAGVVELAPSAVVVDELATDERAIQVDELVTDMVNLGFAKPERDVEVAHPETGRVLSIAEAFWPDGLQPGLGPAIVLELDESDFDENSLAALGCLVFTSIESLREYADGVAGQETREPPGEDQKPPAEQTPLGSHEEVCRRFDAAMREVYTRAKQEAGYNAALYLRMLSEHGGLGTAKRLLHSNGVSEGFVSLWERNRLDLTVENVVLRPEFTSLFSEDERDIARERLREYGLDVHG